MQVMGGIGYTDVFPVERIVRDLRLASHLDRHQRGHGADHRQRVVPRAARGDEELPPRAHEEDAAAADAVDEKDYG